MGCVQTKATGTKEEFRQLNRPTGLPFGAPSALSKLSSYIPTTGPLSSEDYWSRLDYGSTDTVEMDGLRLRYAFVTQRGYYPEALGKANQDAVCVRKDFAKTPKQMLLGVFDGHGVHGTEAAEFAKVKVPAILADEPALAEAPAEAFRAAMLKANQQLHASAVDDSMSGTTAIVCLMRGRQAWVANVGDSRAVLAERRGDDLVALPLSRDQTPFRRDECERVKQAGARVLTLDQIEGLKDPEVECWKNEEEDSGDPPRLWAPNAMFPGTAFTRSIGDSLAEDIGVCAEPEVEHRRLGASNPFLVIASDGVFEFLNDKRVVEMVSQFEDPQEAAIALVVESYHLWLSYETRTDDISAIVVMLEATDAPASPPSQPQMRKPRSGKNMPNGLAKGLSTSKSFVGSLAKSFTQQGYTHLEDGLDDPLVRPNSNPSMDGASLTSRSSRFFSDDERQPPPKRVVERQESRSRHTAGASGSPKMSLPPNVLKLSDSFTSKEAFTSR